jgi:hypothetical protein
VRFLQGVISNENEIRNGGTFESAQRIRPKSLPVSCPR